MYRISVSVVIYNGKFCFLARFKEKRRFQILNLSVVCINRTEILNGTPVGKKRSDRQIRSDRPIVTLIII